MFLLSTMKLVNQQDAESDRDAISVLAVAEAFEEMDVCETLEPMLSRAESRGYIAPDEDAEIHARYTSYLAGRAALLQVLERIEARVGGRKVDWEGHWADFVVALLSACLLLRGTRPWIRLASGSRLLRRKLDEEDCVHGLPRKSFARLYRATTDLRRLRQFRRAMDFYLEQRDAWRGELAADPYNQVVEHLDDVLARLADEDIGWRDRLGYRWFSFRRRHRSAWKTTVFGLFRGSGSLIADLRQPVRRREQARDKRIDAGLREAILADVQAGDVFVTRHDDALSNLFLPGFWPHAALFIGDAEERRALGLGLDVEDWSEADEGIHFLEAKKDGVRFRAAEETLAVDSLVVLRPPLGTSEICEALERAARHAGKPYDFVFDFRTSDRLVCTEVVYRAYHGCGPLEFALCETNGRLCLPAEALIAQALAQGFSVVGVAGLGEDGGWKRGTAAETRLHSSRCGL